MKQHADKPFALIGINSDTDMEMAKKRLAKHEINWRSFWNGPKGPRGTISTDWKVPTWPWTVVIDDEGVIRYVNVMGEALDGAIEALLAEVEEKG